MIQPSDEPFRPDVVLPEQFFTSWRSQAPSKAGEYQLLVAVLEDAIACFQKHAFADDRRGRRLFEEERVWFMDETAAPGDDEAPWLSFEYVCDVLDLEPDFIRRGLERWRDQQFRQALVALHASPRGFDPRASGTHG